MSELSEQARAVLSEGLTKEAIGWLEESHDLAIATRAIFREMQMGHLGLNLTPPQIAQRKQILGIAHAVIEAATVRAIDNFMGSIRLKDATQHAPGTQVAMGGGSPKETEGELQREVSGTSSNASSDNRSDQGGPQ